MLRHILCKLWNFGHQWQAVTHRHHGKPVRKCSGCGYEQYRMASDEDGFELWLTRLQRGKE